MRILIYSSSFFSDNTLPLYKAMLDKGLDVTLLFELYGPRVNLFNEEKMIPHMGIIKAIEYPNFRKYEEYCDLSNVYVENIPNISFKSIKVLKSTRLVSKFIKCGNFDIIHTDMPIMLWKTPLLRYRKKMVLVVHEPIPHAKKLHPMVEFFRKLNFKLIPKIVILNHVVYDDFCQKYGIDKGRVLVNQLGPLDCIKIFSNENGLYDSNKLVFWGRIARYKGLEYLCQAMTMVHDVVPEAQLVVAGDGEFYFDIRPYEELSYITIIHKYLNMDELATVISDAAFTVCPYISSSQSGGVITSLVMGKPVIGTDYETMREMITDGKTGILVPPKDVAALAKAIIRLLKDKKLQKQLMDNISFNNASDDTWSCVVDRYISFYKR